MNPLALFSFFQIIFIVLLTSIQSYFYYQLLKYFSSHKNGLWLKISIHLIFILFNLPVYFLFFLRIHMKDMQAWMMFLGIYPLYIWHFSLAVLFIVLMIGKLLKLPFLSLLWIIGRFDSGKKLIQSSRASGNFQKFDSQRRIFIRKGVVTLAGTAFIGSTYGTFHRDAHELTEIVLPIKNLPGEFEGFSIALISDIHSSIFMGKEKMMEYAAAVNDLHADMIAVTGDFVNSMVEEVYPFAEAFSTLSARQGIYGVLGNHDYYTRNVEAVAKEVNGCGIKLLRNQTVEIKKNNAKLYLLGVDDVGTRQRAEDSFDRTLETAQEQIPKILLCHRPYFFEQAANRNIDLTLSGHTHGGQIVFTKIRENVIAPARLASPYVMGQYTIGSSQMYVSRGIGTVGIPIRINCPPEITKITLVNAGKS